MFIQSETISISFEIQQRRLFRDMFRNNFNFIGDSMKLFRVSLIFSIIAITRVFGGSSDYKSFANALNVVIEKFYVKNNLHVHFLIGSLECEKFASDVINEVLKMNQNIGPFEMKYIPDLIKYKNRNSWLKLENSTIIFIHDKGLIPILIKHVHFNTLQDYTKYQHMVVITKKNKMQFEHSALRTYELPGFLANNINYMLFIYKEEKKLKLETLRRFTEIDCGVNMTKINEFLIHNQTWINDNFSLIETRDFNGCKIYLRFPTTNANVTKSMYNTKLLSRIFKEISGKLNFNYSEIYKNVNNMGGSSIQATKENGKYSRDIEAAMGGFSQESAISKTYEIIITLMDFAVIVPLGDEYTAYEKFILPFEPFTWVCCGATFGVAFLVIILINLTKNRKLQDFVYGYHVTTPAFNVLVAFFGQSQNILPGRNFARFHLMMLIFLCFFIRALYQGIQFDMIYMNLRKNSPDLISEINLKDIHGTEGLNRPPKVLLNDFRYIYYTARDKSDLKALSKAPWNNSKLLKPIIFPRYQGTDKKSMIFRFYNFTNPVKFTKDNFYSFSLGICFRNNDVLYKPFKDVIQRLIEAGITTTFEDQSLSQEPQYDSMFTVLDKGNDFAPLSLAMLEAGFVIWLVSFLATVIVFIGEIAFYLCQKLTKKMKIVVSEKLKMRKRKIEAKRNLAT